MDTLGERLKKLRDENNYTLEYVADNLDTTKTSIARYEKNDREPKSEMLSALADFYKVSTDYLLGRTEERNIHKNEKTKLNDGIRSIAAHKLNLKDDLPDDAIEKINDFIRMVEMDYKNKK